MHVRWPTATRTHTTCAHARLQQRCAATVAALSWPCHAVSVCSSPSVHLSLLLASSWIFSRTASSRRMPTAICRSHIQPSSDHVLIHRTHAACVFLPPACIIHSQPPAPSRSRTLWPMKTSLPGSRPKSSMLTSHGACVRVHARICCSMCALP